MREKITIAVCGAGIAGAATAYYLLENNDNIEVILIDKNQPLSFTTSKSGENFRNYWPQKCMQQFASHSIDLMQELRGHYGTDSFEMIHSGYNFISHHNEGSIFGIDSNIEFEEGIEEILNPARLQNDYPYLNKKIKKIVTIKNAGKVDVYALGSLLIREANKKGAKHVQGEILSITKNDLKFQILLDSDQSISADKIVIAAGPFINHISNMLGIEFPISNTLQRKFIIPDPKKIIPRNMPLTIYADTQFLDWSTEERAFFDSEEKYKWLLEEFPGGLHIKPEGEGIKMGWAFQRQNEIPVWENPKFDIFPQVVLKGASRFIPRLIEYENNIPTPLIEYAGYYTRTKENWPLIGPIEMQNVFVVGALAGYGTMGACAAGKLCANYIQNESKLPDYAAYFHPNRYKIPQMNEEMALLSSDGQL